MSGHHRLYSYCTAPILGMQVNRIIEDHSVQTRALYTLLKYVEEVVKLDCFVKVYVRTYSYLAKMGSCHALYSHCTATTINMQVNRVILDPSIQTRALYTLLK